jgi:site-specific DNA-methyltransferase (adenine-specific)
MSAPTVVGNATLYCGDCLEVLKAIADASVDSIVTDPPYHLVANKKDDPRRASPDAAQRNTGFMGMTWDGGDVAFRVATWAECLRVLKPGGHLLAFSGSRTYHRMACAIEDAGFEIRDQIMWIYGSGFPKSKNLDGDWDGWGTALKPSHEPICMARKPLVGTVAANVGVHGTGAINIGACRVEFLGDADKASAKPQGRVTSKNTSGGNGAAAPDAGRDCERVEFEAIQGSGRWPANVIHDGSAEVLNAFPDAPGQMADVSYQGGACKTKNVYGAMNRGHELSRDRVYVGNGGTNFAMKPGARRLDAGSAARFFYCAKASRVDRHEGLADPGPQFEHGSTFRDAENLGTTRGGNHHPTVKPTDLMAYLCRLVTPPAGTVLDPFMGSGSTGKAAMREGFRFIGIDMTPEYVEIAKARIRFEADRVESERERIERERVEAARQSSLFGESPCAA